MSTHPGLDLSTNAIGEVLVGRKRDLTGRFRTVPWFEAVSAGMRLQRCLPRDVEIGW